MKKVKILLSLLTFFIIIGVTLNTKAATDTQWTDFSNATITLVDRKETDKHEYDLKFENVTFSTSETTKYYVFVTNGSAELDLEKTDEVLKNNATEVWEKTSEKIVPADKMAPFIDINDDIYVKIIEGVLNEESTYEFKEVLTSKKIEKPDISELGKRIKVGFDVHYGSMNTSVNIYEPYDYRQERKITVKIGKVTDYRVLLAMMFKFDGYLEGLMDYAKESDEIISETVTLGTYFDLIGKITLEENAYYYVYSVLDDENNKYRTIEDIDLYQYTGSKDPTLYYIGEYDALNSYDSLDFIWDYIETYKADTDDENTDDENTDGDNTTNDENGKDNTVSNGTLPYTGEGIIIGSLIIMIIIVGAYYAIRVRGLKNIK